MKLTVWKFPVHLADSFEVEMPHGSKFLHLDVQRDNPAMWFLVNPHSPPVSRVFHLVGTGDASEGLDQCTHLGSFLLDNGTFVFHLFEAP